MSSIEGAATDMRRRGVGRAGTSSYLYQRLVYLRGITNASRPLHRTSNTTHVPPPCAAQRTTAPPLRAATIACCKATGSEDACAFVTSS
jgi:hypothetical protein